MCGSASPSWWSCRRSTWPASCAHRDIRSSHSCESPRRTSVAAPARRGSSHNSLWRAESLENVEEKIKQMKTKARTDVKKRSSATSHHSYHSKRLWTLPDVVAFEHQQRRLLKTSNRSPIFWLKILSNVTSFSLSRYLCIALRTLKKKSKNICSAQGDSLTRLCNQNVRPKKTPRVGEMWHARNYSRSTVGEII